MLYNRCIRSMEFRRWSILRIRMFQKQMPKIIESKILIIAMRIEKPLFESQRFFSKRTLMHL